MDASKRLVGIPLSFFGACRTDILSGGARFGVTKGSRSPAGPVFHELVYHAEVEEKEVAPIVCGGIEGALVLEYQAKLCGRMVSWITYA